MRPIKVLREHEQIGINGDHMLVFGQTAYDKPKPHKNRYTQEAQHQ